MNVAALEGSTTPVKCSGELALSKIAIQCHQSTRRDALASLALLATEMYVTCVTANTSRV